MAHGDVAFRFSAVDWFSRIDPKAYFAAYDTPPSLLRGWLALGFSRVLDLVVQQARALVALAFLNPLLLGAGLVAVAGLFALDVKPRAFAVVGAAYAVGVSLLLCVIYHVEGRYLSGLYPIFALSLALVGKELWGRYATNARRRYLAGTAVGAVLIARAAILVSGLQALAMVNRTRVPVCPDAAAFIQREVNTSAPVLTMNPWFVSWDLDRPAVMAPSNGAEAIARTARRYGTAWALTGASAGLGAADLGVAFSNPAPALRALEPVRVFHGESCDVYRLGALSN
jgi:hypothetical protein